MLNYERLINTLEELIGTDKEIDAKMDSDAIEFLAKTRESEQKIKAGRKETILYVKNPMSYATIHETKDGEVFKKMIRLTTDGSAFKDIMIHQSKKIKHTVHDKR